MYPLIYTLGLPIVIISYIMAILFPINICNALSEIPQNSDEGETRVIGDLL